MFCKYFVSVIPPQKNMYCVKITARHKRKFEFVICLIYQCLFYTVTKESTLDSQASLWLLLVVFDICQSVEGELKTNPQIISKTTVTTST